MKLINIYMLCLALAFSTGVDAQQWNSNSLGIHYNIGNIGIGTSSPNRQFHVKREASSSAGMLRIEDELDATYWDFGMTNDNNGNSFEVWYNDGSNNKLFYLGTDGNVGIGTTSPRTGYKLDVRGDFSVGGIGSSSVKLLGVPATGGEFNIGQTSGSGTINFVSNTDVKLMTILNDGNIGVGTELPNEKLHVDGKIAWGSYGSKLGTDQGGSIELKGNGTPYLDFSNSISDDYDIRFMLRTDDVLSLTGGSLGIGTSTTGSHSLAVEGSIGAREIKVEAGTGWSDFVFYDNYELPTLIEVENHIKKKGHLKDIPSEAEVTENGINLGEMNAKLLQKVEELTLYLIDQNKKIEELTGKVQHLENK